MKFEITDDDFYNLDMALGGIIAASLKEFKKRTVGVPASLGEGRTQDEAMEKWRSIIDEMAWSFEEISNGHKNAPDIMALGKDEYDRQRKKYDKRVHHGHKLFMRYFSNLWI